MSTAETVTDGSVFVEKIDARVFCFGTEGGNPVTIFASPEPLSGSLQQKLAQSCDWESVLVCTDASSPSNPTMAFFMPSGEEVSFCAHAAIGGAVAMGEGHSGSWDFAAAMTGDSFSIDTEGVEGERSDRIAANLSRCCRLQMKGVRFDEAPLGNTGMATLKDWSNRLNWSVMGAESTSSNKNATTRAPVPTNASVSRPKTLVRLDSVDAVQRAGTPPSDGSFAGACAKLDDSTGVYLYAPIDGTNDDDNNNNNNGSEICSYECRQFPRSSGYPEDPATGIAAAALAASLRFGDHGPAGSWDDEAASPIYDIYQGTAMGRPSLIQVLDLRKEESGTTISFGLQGRVEIDETSTIQVID